MCVDVNPGDIRQVDEDEAITAYKVVRKDNKWAGPYYAHHPIKHENHLLDFAETNLVVQTIGAFYAQWVTSGGFHHYETAEAAVRAWYSQLRGPNSKFRPLHLIKVKAWGSVLQSKDRVTPILISSCWAPYENWEARQRHHGRWGK